MTESFKVVTIGQSGVGKTSIVQTYIGGSFKDDIAPTVGIGYSLCKLIVEEKTIMLNIWDTASQEKYAPLIPFYVRGADLVLLVYDLSNIESLIAIKDYYEKLLDILSDEVNIVLCGNKFDLSLRSLKDVEEWAHENKISSFVVSAKTNTGLDILFRHIAEKCLDIKENRERKKNEVYQFNTGDDTGSRGCC